MGICYSKTSTTVVHTTIVQQHYYVDYAVQVERHATQLDYKITALNACISDAFEKYERIKKDNPQAKKPKIKILADKALRVAQKASKSLNDLKTLFPNLKAVHERTLIRLCSCFGMNKLIVDTTRERLMDELAKV